MKKRLLLAMVLSLVPGLAHLYLGRHQKAAALLAASAGIIVGEILSKSLILKFLLTGAYLLTALPAGMEAYLIEAYAEPVLYTNNRWYITILLLASGFSALPLLWQSSCFSKPEKIAWTIAVPILAVLFFSGLAVYWHRIELFLEQRL